MAQENRKPLGRYTSHHEHHHKEDSKNTLEDSWSDSNEDDHEESANIINNEVALESSTMNEPNTYHNKDIGEGDNGIFISESKYLRNCLKRFDLENAKSIKTPMSTDLKLTLDMDWNYRLIASKIEMYDWVLLSS
ncbi:hypothetical protein Tco_0161679 [Tanacetum coccineum]